MQCMPRADRITLTAAGLRMPPVNDLSNKGFANVLLDRAFGGLCLQPPAPGYTGGGAVVVEDVRLFANLARLLDKALREYDAARDALITYLNPPDAQLRTSGYVIVVDHMENTIGATHRAVVIQEVLRSRGFGRSAPRLTEAQELRLRYSTQRLRTPERADSQSNAVEEDSAVRSPRASRPAAR